MVPLFSVTQGLRGFPCQPDSGIPADSKIDGIPKNQFFLLCGVAVYSADALLSPRLEAGMSVSICVWAASVVHHILPDSSVSHHKVSIGL
jgi:hypothetical protein